MGEKRFILAIDHGTSGVKASIVSTHGQILASDFEKTPIYFLPEGGAEQDPGHWWDALLAVSGRLVARRCCSTRRYHSGMRVQHLFQHGGRGLLRATTS